MRTLVGCLSKLFLRRAMLRSFLIIACKGQVALDTLIKLPEVELVGVYTAKKQGINSDFLTQLPPRLGNTPIHAEEVNHVDLYKILKILQVDVLWVIGWSKLIPENCSQHRELLRLLPSCSTSEK